MGVFRSCFRKAGGFWKEVSEKGFHETYRGILGWGIFGLQAQFYVHSLQKGAQGLGNFQPIYLLGSMYKVMTKVLAGRMRKVLNGIIFQYQNAFVKGRQMLGCSMIMTDIMDSKSNKKTTCLGRNFLDFITWEMGFGSKRRKWGLPLHLTCEILCHC